MPGFPRIPAAYRRVPAAAFNAVTPLGWTVAALAGVCWLAGGVLGWREALIAGLTLTLVLAAAVVFILGRLGRPELRTARRRADARPQRVYPPPGYGPGS